MSAPSPRAVTVQAAPRDGSAHLTRASGERWTRLPYDSTAPLGPLPCEWHTADSYGSTVAEWEVASTWTTREARALLPHLRGRSRGGRPTAAPVSPDGALVAEAMNQGHHVSREALAAALGVSRKSLSRACRPVNHVDHYELSVATREALRAIVAKGPARKA